MKKLASVKWKHYINYIIIGLATVVLAVMAFTSNPIGLSRSLNNLVTNAGIAIILATSLSMVVGFLGELSLGHAGFMCVGAYMGGKTAVVLYDAIGKLNLPDAVADPLVLLSSLIIGGVAAMACGFIIGLPALRLKGDYLAIVTLAFGEIIRIVFFNSGGVFGDESGFKTPRYDKKVFFIFILIMVLITLFVIQNLIRSKHGRAITAIRDSEIAAKATGINVTKYKLYVFAIAAFFAGIAGVLHSFNTPSKIYADTFDYNYSIEILVMVVLGGMGSINGSIIMAVAITFINTALQTQLQGGMAVLKNLIYALILIVIVIYNNAPGLKNWREKYSLKNLYAKFIKKKSDHDPAKVRDDEAKWDRVPTKIEMDEVLSVDIQVNSPYTPDKRQKGDK